MTFKISWRVFSVGKRDLSILTIMDNFIDVQVVHLRVFKRLLNFSGIGIALWKLMYLL
jgi:hypothetical protein